MRLQRAGPDNESAMAALACERCPLLEPAILADLFEPNVYDLYGAFCAVEGSDLVGWAALAHRTAMPAGWRGLRVFVRRACESDGVGSALRAAVLETLDESATQLRSFVFDDDERSLTIGRHWGFDVQEHSISSRLDLTSTQPSAAPPGVSVEACGSLEFPDPDAVQECLTASQTNPEFAAGLHIDLAMLRGFVGSGEIAIGALARVDGRPAAICHGSIAGDSVHLTYTGVDPAYRGRGLARLVKTHAHRLAHDAGATVSMTDNETDNHGILHVNASMGYRRAYGTYWLVQPLTG
jgi:GNAT superfamily N-acetyltransferase